MIKKFFSQFKNCQLNFLETNNQMFINGNIIDSILSDKYTGIVIREVFSETFCESIIEKYEGIDPSKKFTFAKNSGECFPISFSSLLGQNLESTEDCNLFFQKLSRDFEDNFHPILDEINEKVLGIIQGLDNSISIQPAEFNGCNSSLKLNTFSVRKLYPYKGGLKFHVGNSFKEFYYSFYEFVEIPKSSAQLSYFIVLKSAKKGGDLKVFDAKYPDYKELKDERGLFSGKKKIYLENLKNKVINIGVGDMIIFDGGNYWHEVTEPKGEIPRYTLGGFISIFDKKGIVWS